MNAKYLTAVALVVAASLAAAAQTTTTPLSITGTAGSYSENFDSMTTAGGIYPAGFNGFRFAGSGTANQPLTPIVDTGALNGGAVYNYGTTLTSTDRALGTHASGTTSPAFGVVFVNNTGATLDLSTLSFSFRVEQYRTGNTGTGVDAALEQATFRYATGPAIDVSFPTASGTTAAALNLFEVRSDLSPATNGPINGNGQTGGVDNFATVNAAAGVLTGSVASGDRLVLRWEDFNSGGNDAGFAIDDLVINGIFIVPVPEPATVGLLATAGLGLAGCVRRRLVG